MSSSPEEREQLAKLEDQMLGEAAEKALASSPRVGSEEFTAALKALAELPDEAIDTADIPEAPEENWDRRKRR
jgi:hypothetical protein